jgi:hypothetical protein
MKTFELTAEVTISVYTKVEAETLEEAIQIADDRNLMQLIHGGTQDENDEWVCDELDGMAFNIHEA